MPLPDLRARFSLLPRCCRYEPTARLSAAAALAHPWFGQSAPLTAISSTVASIGKVAVKVTESVDDGWLERQVVRNGTREAGGFTEAYLMEEGLSDGTRKRGDDDLPPALAGASNTIAWWQSRQAQVQARLSRRRAVQAVKTIAEGGKKAASKMRLFDLAGVRGGGGGGGSKGGDK